MGHCLKQMNKEVSFPTYVYALAHVCMCAHSVCAYAYMWVPICVHHEPGCLCPWCRSRQLQFQLREPCTIRLFILL